MSPLVICLIIFVLTVIGYCSGIWSLATVSLLSMLALTLTGCIDAGTALGCFSNGNVIMVAGMCVIAAGFNRTQFCTKLATGISGIAKGSITKLMLGYCLIGMLLSQFIQSPVAVFGIVAPMCISSAKAMGLSPSKVMFPLGVVVISTCATLPVGGGAIVAAQLNSLIETYGYTAHMVQLLDPMKAKLPMLIITLIYGILIGPRFAPAEPPRTPSIAASSAQQKEALKPVQEWAGLIIFFASAAALMFASKLGLANWQVCVIGALLMVTFGTLKPQEAARAIPISLLLLIVGSLSMASALGATGAGEVIGNAISKLVITLNGNSYLIGFVFFLAPFILTQFMSNTGAMLIFYPIALATCASINGNPVGLLILSQSAGLTAFLTPMATVTVPYMMDYGGYTQASLVKQGWFYALISCFVSVAWTMTLFPIL